MNSRSKVVTGSIFVLAGAISLLGNLQILNENFLLPLMGAAFLIVYFLLGSRKKYGNIGFLIPGIILPAMQILKIADDNNAGEKAEIVIVFGVLAFSFLLVYLFHSRWFKELRKGQRNWPLHVSILLVLFGCILYAIEYFNWAFGVVLLNNVWPGILVIIGARMLYKALRGSKQNLKD